ncbi:hypothetical protein MMC09_005598 [Bachmanniomyces sp. S44760]|nr:hypothetical protein [Bachmanniomyces sp. S44760]
MLDLELMHQYATATSLTMSDITKVQHTWQVALTEIALSHEFLMHAELALAAVHILHTNSSMSSTKRRVYEDAAAKHKNLALQEALPVFNDITQDNCHALFGLAGLVAMLAFVFPHQSSDRSFNGPVDDIREFFGLLRGVSTILDTSLEWVLHGPLASHLGHDWHPAPISLRSDLKKALNQLVETNNDKVTDSKTRGMYNATIEHVRKAFEDYKTISSERSLVFGWVIGVSEDYLLNLKSKSPMAWVILAYYGVLLHSVNGKWWSEGRGKLLVEYICEELSEEWQSSLQWPKEMVKKPVNFGGNTGGAHEAEL